MTRPHKPKVTHVVGNRPHYMKLAPIAEALARAGLVSEVINTGQHWDDNLAGQFQREFGIRIDVTLTAESGNHGVQTGSMMIALENHLLQQTEPPQVLLVYGDTNSTLAAALVAAKLDILVGHVEGGVRAEYLDSFMPEEINRKLVDDLSRWVYVPTERCATELRREGFDNDRIVNCGDVMFDRLLQTMEKARKLPFVRNRPFAIATVHRAENTGEAPRLFAILDALRDLAEKLDVVLAMHPRTQKALASSGRLADYERHIDFIPPIGHTEMIRYMMDAEFVISDSGGVPKEAAFMGKRSVILRRQAVWSELIESGFAELADPLKDGAVAHAIERVATNPRMPRPLGGFGDGHAAKAIAEHLAASLRNE